MYIVHPAEVASHIAVQQAVPCQNKINASEAGVDVLVAAVDLLWESVCGCCESKSRHPLFCGVFLVLLHRSIHRSIDPSDEIGAYEYELYLVRACTQYKCTHSVHGTMYYVQGNECDGCIVPVRVARCNQEGMVG